MTSEEFDEQWSAIKERSALLEEAQRMIDQINARQVDDDRAFAGRLQRIVDHLDMDYTYDVGAGKWVLTLEKQAPHFDELAQEILAQLEAIESRSSWMEWPFTTVSSSTAWTLDVASVPSGQTFIPSGYDHQKKPKPIRAKVRYTAHWRKEQIERKLRRV